MAETRVRIGWLMVLLLGVLAPGWGQSPKVSLRLEEVTCREAAAALSLATGIPIEIRAWILSDIPRAVEPPLIDLNERASFDWRETTYARALRELADRYRLRPEPGYGGGHILEQVGIEGPLPVYTSAPRDSPRGMRVEVRRVSVSGDYSGRPPGDQVSLTLAGIAADGDASAVYRVENLVARDDRGGVLTAERIHLREVQHTYPDEWLLNATLTGLQPGATRLEWLEGDLMAQSRENVRRCEIPLPPPAGGGRREFPGLVVEFQELLPKVPPESDFARERLRHGPFLRAKLIYPEGRPRREFLARASVPDIALVGASGRRYARLGIAMRGRNENGVEVSDLTCPFPPIEEPVVGLRFEFWEWGEPQRLAAFRIPAIPLLGGTGRAGTVYYGAFHESELAPGDPLYAAGGGVLVSRVQRAGRPAPEGRLSVGIAPADGTPGRRWYEVVVGEDGIGRLPHLRPGAYHVLRLYRPLQHERRPAPGWWVNSDVVVRVAAGQDTTLPVLDYADREPPVRPTSLPARERTVHATLNGMRISFSRTVEFLEQPQVQVDGSMELELAGNALGIATERVAGIRNVIGADDRGSLLNWRTSRPITVTPADAGRGFTWRETPHLTPPHPLAKKIAWLEGDLLAYRTVLPVRLEVPLPLPEQGLRREVDAIRFELDHFGPPPPGDVQGLPPDGVMLLRGRVLGSRGTRFAAPGSAYPQPLLVGRSGKTYAAARSANSVGSGRWEVRAYYSISEPATAARFDLSVWTDLAPAGSFRLTDVAFPLRRAFIPPREAAAAAVQARDGRLDPPGSRPRAFFQEGGARLIMPVRIAEQAAPGGVLTVGLAQRTREGWSTVRWMELPVIQGAASLQDLQPGTYRLLRAYQTDQPPDVPAPGRWTQSDVEVTLTAGKETSAPALQWAGAP